MAKDLFGPINSSQGRVRAEKERKKKANARQAALRGWTLGGASVDE